MQVSTPTGSLMRELAAGQRCDIATSVNGMTLLRQKASHGQLMAAFYFERAGEVMCCCNHVSKGLFERLVECEDLIGVAMDNLRYSRVERVLEMDPLSVDVLIELHGGMRRRLVPMRTGDVMIARSFTAWSLPPTR